MEVPLPPLDFTPPAQDVPRIVKLASELLPGPCSIDSSGNPEGTCGSAVIDQESPEPLPCDFGAQILLGLTETKPAQVEPSMPDHNDDTSVGDGISRALISPI